jgi:hypothetical protein
MNELFIYLFVYNVFIYDEIFIQILSFAGKWMKLENIILSEINQFQDAKVHIFSHL